jgi:hypothetical protein
VTVETFTAATDHRDPTSAAQRVRNYVRAFAQLGREGRAVAAVDTLDHVALDVRDLDALVDAVDHGAGRVPVNRALADARDEVAALRVAMRQKNGQPGMAYAVVAALRAEYDLVPKGSAALWRDLARRADGGDPGAAMQLVGAVLAALEVLG